MASIQKKGDVYYIVEYVRVEGAKKKPKWVRLGKIPFAHARTALNRYHSDKSYLRLDMAAPYKGKLKDLFKECQDHAKAAKLRRPNTLIAEGTKYSTLTKKFGELRIDELDPMKVDLFFAEKSYKANTVILFIKALKLAYDYAIAKNYIRAEKNPVPKIKKPKQELMPPKAVLHEDILRVFSHLSEKARAPFEFMYYAGLRPSEAARLERKNIDLKNENIDLYPDQTKTAERGIIPINPSLLPTIKRLLAAETKYLFPWGETYQKEFKKPWAKACKQAGIHITPYQLRHSFATRLLEKTGDIRTVQQLMRHTDIKMTTRYATAVDAKLHDAIKNF